MNQQELTAIKAELVRALADEETRHRQAMATIRAQFAPKLPNRTWPICPSCNGYGGVLDVNGQPTSIPCPHCFGGRVEPSAVT